MISPANKAWYNDIPLNHTSSAFSFLIFQINPRSAKILNGFINDRRRKKTASAKAQYSLISGVIFLAVINKESFECLRSSFIIVKQWSMELSAVTKRIFINI